MKLAVALAAGIAAFAMPGGPVRADPVPERATGIWSVGRECAGEAPVAMVNPRTALMFERRNGRPAVAFAKAEWIAGSLVLSLEHGAGEVLLPPLGSLAKCEALPGLMPVAFAEAVAMFRRFGDIDEFCLREGGPGPRCVAVGFELIDITGDGRLSRAEIARAIRAAAFFVGHRLIADRQGTAFVPVEELLPAWLAGSALGPVIAGNLVGSHDYDHDGLLSLGELMQDRTPEEGLEGALAAMAAEIAPEALSAVMRSATGVLGFLR